MASMPPEIIDKWQIVDRLGAGGIGEVFAARHTVLGHLAAIKVLAPRLAQRPDEVARFLQEGRIAAQLQHPHILRVQDVGRLPDGRPYLVMDLLEGGSLASRLKQVRVFTPRMVGSILKSACNALEYAHELGVVHRDIKPDNLFLAIEHGEEVLKVLDFGFARVQVNTATAGRRLTAPHALVGTPKYMSPEQALALEDVDRRTDVWSLGIVAFRMLTGQHPFSEKGTPFEVLSRLVDVKVARPSTVNPELPLSIDGWMLRALANDRTKRFQTAREMYLAYDQALASIEESDEATTVTTEPEAQRLARQRQAPRPLDLPSDPRGTITRRPNEPVATFTPSVPSDPSLPGQSAVMAPAPAPAAAPPPVRRSPAVRRARLSGPVLAVIGAGVVIVFALLTAVLVRLH